jgi:hypothetical protein
MFVVHHDTKLPCQHCTGHMRVPNMMLNFCLNENNCFNCEKWFHGWKEATHGSTGQPNQTTRNVTHPNPMQRDNGLYLITSMSAFGNCIGTGKDWLVSEIVATNKIQLPLLSVFCCILDTGAYIILDLWHFFGELLSVGTHLGVILP